MVSFLRKIGALGLIMALVLGAFLIPAGAEDSRAVDYSLSKDDPSGDSYGIQGFEDSDVAADADILQVTSTISDNNIVLEMKVSGTIHVSGSIYFDGYLFNIDINGDDTMDWLAGAYSYANAGGTNAQLQDDEGNFENFHYLENATGDETDTVTIQFPLSYISNVETIDSWNIYGKANVVKTGTSYSYEDLAPDDGFTDTGGGNGGGEEPTKNEEIFIHILNPETDEKIPAGGMTDTYRIEGEVTPPLGDTIAQMNYRIIDPLDSGWQTVQDDSGGGTFSKWYGEMSTSTDSGSRILNDGKNTLEVKATTLSGDYNTATVIFYFNSDEVDTDRDGDGMPNDYEDANGLDPDDASDADEDADGDGYKNYVEYKEGTDPNDAADHPEGGGSGYDPTAEEPTDKVIKVSISTAKWVVKDLGDDLVKYDISITGTTSGVKYCELLMVPYYNGVANAEDDWMEPFDWEDEAGQKDAMKDFGYTAFWFKSTSGDDWKTWEYKITGEVNTSDIGGDDDIDDTEPDKVMVYVRAYSDTSGNNWNQASKEIKISTGGDSDKDDDKDESPGFEAVFTIIALAVVVMISRVYYRRR